MDNKFENRNISFEKHTGRETKLKVLREIPITKGGYGKIFDTDVEIKGRKRRFIVKKYFESSTPGEPSAIDNARTAFENYSSAKKAGLKVFPTVRISEDGKSILMTAGFSDDEMCIGSNSNITLRHLDKPLIKNIDAGDLDKFLSDFFAEGLKAAKAGIKINFDVPFFILSKDVPTKIDFILGDLDHLKKVGTSKLTGRNNIEAIRTALIGFCHSNIDQKIRKDFLGRVAYYYEKSFDAIDAYKKLE